MTSFFICDDDWEKEKEITLEEMDDNPEMDSWVMKETQLSELVEDEKQKLLYVFDYMTERCFFIELSEIITGKEMKGAKCTKKAGEAPKQTVDFEEMAAAGGSLDLDENFYGDQDFDMEDSTKRVRRFGRSRELLRRREILNRHYSPSERRGLLWFAPKFYTRMHTLIVLIGPTGVGKTELSLRLAEHFHTCIVSADSRQLYADLKIGTAAPTPGAACNGYSITSSVP